MKIEILGVGNGFSPELGNTSFLIWNDDNTSAVLMDCGGLVFGKIRELEITQNRDILSKIDTVFISHTHGDHAGSLPTLLQWLHWQCGKMPKVAGVPLRPLLDATLLESADGYPLVTDDRFEIIPTIHGTGPAVGTHFNGVLYSGDSAHNLLNHPLAEQSHTIIHEVAPATNGAHIGIDDLAQAPSHIRAKTWLTHYGSATREPLKIKAAKCGFAGLLYQGQVLTR